MKNAIVTLFLFCGVSMYSQSDELLGQFQEADVNGDGVIQVIEVQRMIDGFFIGSHDHGVMYIHSLIDFFFEQKS